MVTKDPQNVHRNCFWTILVTFIFDVKIDIIMCEPHYMNLFFFVNLLHSLCVWLFDIWHLFDILTSFNLNHLSLSQGYFYEMHANRSNAIGMDTSMPLMHLCRRWARESYCTGDLTTHFSHFFFFHHSVHAGMGHASFLEGEGYCRMRLMNTIFPDAKLDDACIETIPPPYVKLHG